MKSVNLSKEQISIVQLISDKPLTSFEILNEIDSFSSILSLYDVMDELHLKGIIKSFIKNGIKYHYALN